MTQQRNSRKSWRKARARCSAAAQATLALLGLFATLASRAETYILPADGGNIVGEERYVIARQEDTFSDIARRYNVGFNELVHANSAVDPWVPGEGTQIVLPTRYVLPRTPRDGIVLNIPEMRLYHYPKPVEGRPAVVVTHPVSVGRMEWNTPLGRTQIVKKQANPVWYPPASVRAEHAQDGDVLPESIPAGPDNPLGLFALRLGIPGYLIHGTNRPYGVGMRVTHGCVRLYPEDIKSLFDRVDVGTPVYIVNQPYKAGWANEHIYFEAHEPLDEDEATKANNKTPAVRAIVDIMSDGGADVDWDKVLELADAASGIPTVVSMAPVPVTATVLLTPEPVPAAAQPVTAPKDKSRTSAKSKKAKPAR